MNAQAGANQSQNLASLMRNYQTAIDATNTALNSNGSASKENARYMESMEGKLQNLKSAWENFSRTMVNSDLLKTGIDALTKSLDFLASDAGQSIIKVGAAFASAYIAAKPFMALFSGASALKNMSKFAGITRIATRNLKGGKTHIDGATKGITRLSKAAGKGAPALGKFGTKAAGLATVFSGGAVGWGLLGAAGITAGILALNKAIDGETDPEKKYKKAKDELDELQESYAGVRKEIEKIEKVGNKRKKEAKKKNDPDAAVYTKGEERRLGLLKQQEAVLKEQLELKKQLANDKWEKKTNAPQTKKKEVKDKSTSRAGAIGKGSASLLKANEVSMAKQLGYTNKLSAAMNDYEYTLSQVGAKYEQNGRVSEKSVTELKNGIQGIKDEQQEWIDHFGSVEKMPEKYRELYDESKKLTDAYDNLEDVQADLAGQDWSSLTDEQVENATKTFKDLGSAIGISVDESGKLEKVNYGQFVGGLQSAGLTADQAKDALIQLGQQNPNIKVNVDGVEVAGDQIAGVVDFMGKLNGSDAEATVTIDGAEYAVEDIGSVDNYMRLVNGQTSTGYMTIEGARDAYAQVEDFIDLNIPDKTATVEVTGTGDASGEVENVSGELESLPQSTTPVVQVQGADAGIATVSQLTGSIKKVPDKNPEISAHVSGQDKVDTMSSSVSGLPSSKNIHISMTGSISPTAQKILDSGHNAQGTRHAPEGLSEVNEQGWELIRDAKTGRLRIAGGGKRTITHLNEGDIVYTHAESKRMVADDKDIIVPQHKTGKKQKKYNKARQTILDNFEKKLEEKKHLQKMYHWTDAQFQKVYKKLYNTFNAKLKKENKNWKGVKTSGLGRDIIYPYKESGEDVNHERATKAIDKALDKLSRQELTPKNIKKAKAVIQKHRKHISKEEASEYYGQIKTLRAESASDKTKESIEAKFTNLDYGGSQKKLKTAINNAYRKGKITAQEKADYLKRIDEYNREGAVSKSKENIESAIASLEYGAKAKDVKAIINKAYKNKEITKQEKADYLKQVSDYTTGKASDKAKDKIESAFTALDYGGKIKDVKKAINEAYKNKQITSQEKADYLSRIKDYQAGQKSDKAKSSIDTAIEGIGTTTTLAAVEKQINEAAKNKLITTSEKDDLLKQAREKDKEVRRNKAERELGNMMTGLESGGNLDKVNAKINQMAKEGLITAEEKEDYLKDAKERAQQYKHDQATKNIENYMSSVRGTNEDFAQAKKKIQEAVKSGAISAEEQEEYLKQAYKQNADYNMKMFQNGKVTYTNMKKIIEQYYKEGKLTAAEYYEYIEQLAQEQFEKEKERIEKQKQANDDKYSLAKAYVNRQIELLEKEDKEKEKTEEKQERENKLQEEQNKLIEAQNNLMKAKSQLVKVYREGRGFVYEEDAEAIKEATDALKEQQKAVADVQKEINEVKQEEVKNEQLEKWQAILDMFDEAETLANIKELENKVGGTAAGLFGGMGTDINKWTAYIKNSLATSLGLSSVIDAMSEITDYTDMLAYLQGNGTVAQSKITAAINKNRFASGTLNSPAGLARVAEQGYEIALLGKGDAVMPHNVSRNLMDWGAYSPHDFAKVMNGEGKQVSYNFDKLVLPNVANANDFMNELNRLPNKALQFGTSRV